MLVLKVLHLDVEGAWEDHVWGSNFGDLEQVACSSAPGNRIFELFFLLILAHELVSEHLRILQFYESVMTLHKNS